MKYTFVIPQAGVVRAGLIGKVTLADLCVLNYVEGWFFHRRSKRITVDQQEFVWLKGEHAVSELPLLFNPEADRRTGRNQLSAIIKRLVAAKLIDTRKFGRDLYLRPTTLAVELHSSRDSQTVTPTIPIITESRDDTVTEIRDDPAALSTDGNIYQGNVDKETPPTPFQGECVPASGKSSDPSLKDDAEAIYAAYPKQVARPAALRAIRKALRQHPADFLLERTRRYAKTYSGESRYIPNPATWFNQERFLDDPATWTRAAAPSQGRASTPPRTFDDLPYDVHWTPPHS